jgi:hypothetical protein
MESFLPIIYEAADEIFCGFIFTPKTGLHGMLFSNGVKNTLQNYIIKGT